MKKEGFGKGNWGSEKLVYRKKGEIDPEDALVLGEESKVQTVVVGADTQEEEELYNQ